ncbi:MAG TPA: TetR/AcrR family transcriptional regulator [Sphingobium sp.]|nr:TetR/AcrR family transcriptional regulator [Sphingobium sp.]
MTSPKSRKSTQKAKKAAAPVVTQALPRAEARRQEIILAAAAEFSRKGYAEATLADIAQRLGIHTAALYYYFENKDAVVQAVLHLAAERISIDLEEPLKKVQDATPIEKLRVAIRAYVLTSIRKDQLSKAFWKIYDQVSPELWNSVRDHKHTMFPIWEELITEAAAAGQIRTDIPAGVLRHMLIGALVWIPEWYDPKGKQTLEDLADSFISMFLGSMSTAPASIAAPTPSAAAARRAKAKSEPEVAAKVKPAAKTKSEAKAKPEPKVKAEAKIEAKTKAAPRTRAVAGATPAAAPRKRSAKKQNE